MHTMSAVAESASQLLLYCINLINSKCSNQQNDSCGSTTNNSNVETGPNRH